MKGITWAAMLNSPGRLFQSECPDRQRQDPQGCGAGRRSLGRIKVLGVKLGERLYEVNVLDLLFNSKAQTVCKAKCCLWLKHLTCFVWAKSLWFNFANGNSLRSEDLRCTLKWRVVCQWAKLVKIGKVKISWWIKSIKVLLNQSIQNCQGKHDNSQINRIVKIVNVHLWLFKRQFLGMLQSDRSSLVTGRYSVITKKPHSF